MIFALAFAVLSSPAAHAQSGESSEGLRGRLAVSGEPVPGVGVTVYDEGGAEIGTATSGPDGSWEIPVPGPGTYRIVLDVAALPEGVRLTAEDRGEIELPVNPLQIRPVAFPLTTGEAGASGPSTPSTLDRAAQLFVDGVKFGLIIAMSAVGLSLIFGTTGLTNFAHGGLVTFGALIAWFFNVTLGITLILAALLAIVAGFVVGGSLERFFFRPLRARKTSIIALIVITIGMSIFVRYFYLYLFGGRSRPYNQYAVQEGIELGPVRISPAALISIVISLVVLGLVGLLLQRTRIGKAMRAVADNRDLASSSGIDVPRVILLVWACGGALAALGGVLFGLAEQVTWEMGFQLLLLMFAGVTLGGLGTAYGALVGSLLIGILVQMSTLVVAPELKNVVALGALIIVLVVRPQGIFGQRERLG